MALNRTELSWPGASGEVPPEAGEILRGVARRATLERVALLEIDAVHLMTLPGNVASERVAEKAGFDLVGTLDDYKPSRAVDPDAHYRVNRWVLRGDPEGPR